MRILEPIKGSCSEQNASCFCMHDKDHAGPHQCVCGGRWNHDGSIVELPTTGDPIMDDFAGFVDKLFGSEPDE